MARRARAPGRAHSARHGPPSLGDLGVRSAAAGNTWKVIAVAATILLLTMGARQSMGLFVLPINAGTGISIVSISFALALGQLLWGTAQPLFGIVADRFGTTAVLVAGGLLLALGMATTPFMSTAAGLVLSQGVFAAIGAGAGSFAILIGATASRIRPEHRSLAAGVINAGGSAGQLLFAPLVQAIMAAAGWTAALFTLAAAALLTLPLAVWLGRGARGGARPDQPAAAPPGPGIVEQLGIAAGNRSYWYLHAGFFTCGFHIAFLSTHLPGEVALCGLPAAVSATALALIGGFNMIGSLAAGALGNYVRMKHLLAAMYVSRAIAIAVFLAAPRTAASVYVFSAVMGVTWLATVPPTAGLVGKLFGMRHLATLFGMTLVSHQVGAFFGAWLGGVAIGRFGDFGWMWRADIGLALLAGLISLPIREAKPGTMPAPA
jgi:MFS family permease